MSNQPLSQKIQNEVFNQVIDKQLSVSRGDSAIGRVLYIL
jgi:hypothetical protein